MRPDCTQDRLAGILCAWAAFHEEFVIVLVLDAPEGRILGQFGAVVFEVEILREEGDEERLGDVRVEDLFILRS
jgi:hypothetical protein